jgi:ribosomal protein L21E
MSEVKEFAVGDRVTIISLPSYVKTADPMPMLRPPSVLSLGETGVVMDRRPGGYWGVKFSRGVFLMESQYLDVAKD